MKISRSVKVWVIVNSVILSIVLVFFILGLLTPKYWGEILYFANILIVPLFIFIFYQGFYIGGFVSVITLVILILQIYDIKKSGMHIPAIWITGEVFIILVGILTVLPITFEIIGNLCYMIPGW